ncbi:MAG TPA: hypothetical protein VIW24_01765 [Aldersonia sp.]
MLAPDHLFATAQELGADVRSRFDFLSGPRGRTVLAGTVFRVTEALARRVYSDRSTGLGYALLRVGGAPGAQPIGPMHTESTGALRGWIDLGEAAPALEPGTGLVIVQHLSAGPLRLGHDAAAVLGLSGDGARVYYDLPTEPGSSGAPCFTPDLTLAAIHVGPASVDRHAPRGAGVGVLASAVLRDLRERGFGDIVGRAFV